MDRFRPTEAGAFLCSVFVEAQRGIALRAEKRVLLGRISGPHALKGEVMVHSFTEVPEDIAIYGPLEDASGRRTFELKIVRVTEKGLIARVSGVSDRTGAEALKGTELWIARERLPETDDGAFYHADLIGLAAVAADGQEIGEIVSVQNFGAGDLIEIRLSGSARTELIPFTDAFVPEVDLATRRVVVVMP